MIETPYEKERRIRLKMAHDFPYYAENCLKIRPKDGGIEPFKLNKVQKYLHAKIEEQREKYGYVRVIILKGRQQGASTYIEGRGYWFVTHNPGMRAFILTHDDSATSNLFEMAKRFHDDCPINMRPSVGASNAKELFFDKLDSGYKVGTAGNKAVGRSSTIQYLHASEAAFYSHATEHSKGIMQAVPFAPGTEIYLESTANGVGNWFHQQWQAAESGESVYQAIFLPWYWQDEYEMELPDNFKLTEEEEELKHNYSLSDKQIAWRRMKISELSANGQDGARAFQQEYPNNPTEAFVMSDNDVYMPSELVMTARKMHDLERVGAKLLGVDPARFGDDRTAIIRRQGRVAYGLETYKKKDTMQIAGIVKRIIDAEQPDAVFIDVGGLGAGVVDRLVEMGYGDIIIPVNSSERAMDEDRFTNKRAEMWFLGREWLLDMPCQLPDSNELHADLCNTKYDNDSKDRLKIEKKSDMKKRGVRSSDAADAFLLTFARPINIKNLNKEKRENEKAAVVMARNIALNKIRRKR